VGYQKFGDELFMLLDARPRIPILLLCICLCMQGCLHGMRQKASFPYGALAITGRASQTLLGQLQFDVLTYIDVKVAIDPKDADLIVEILHDGLGSQIASSSAVGQITGYNIDDVVVLRVLDKNGNELITETQIYCVRDTNFSASTVLSADIAQQQAVADIRKELAMQITIRLMSIGRRANR
jgi:LPS-assembly lipoprotein